MQGWSNYRPETAKEQVLNDLRSLGDTHGRQISPGRCRVGVGEAVEKILVGDLIINISDNCYCRRDLIFTI